MIKKNKKLINILMSIFCVFIYTFGILLTPFEDPKEISYSRGIKRSTSNTEDVVEVTSDIDYVDEFEPLISVYEPDIVDFFSSDLLLYLNEDNESFVFSNAYKTYLGTTSTEYHYTIFTNEGFGSMYGFEFNDIENFFNAIYIKTTSSATEYYIGLANATSNDDSTQYTFTNHIDVFYYKTGTISFVNSKSYFALKYSSTDTELTTSIYNVSNMSLYQSVLSSSLGIGSGTYTLISPLFDGVSKYYMTPIVYSLKPVANHYNYYGTINYNMYCSFNHYTETAYNQLVIDLSNYDIYFTNGDIKKYVFKNDVFVASGFYVGSITDTDTILTETEIKIFDTIFNSNYYPETKTYNGVINEGYYLMDLEQAKNLDSISFNVPFIYNFDNEFLRGFRCFDGVLELITFSGSGISFYDYNTNTFCGEYDEFDLYFNILNVSSLSFNQTSINYLNNTFTRVSSFPQEVNGWYTFHLSPFESLDSEYFGTSISYTYDIPFTSNSKGYDSFTINISGNDYESANFDIEYIINESVDSVYEKNGGWSNINNRQIYLDKKILKPEAYDLLKQMGTFTFISNRDLVGVEDYTLTDMFWGIADVPFVLLSNFLGFELFGTNLFTAIISMLSLGIALFIIRKIF